MSDPRSGAFEGLFAKQHAASAGACTEVYTGAHHGPAACVTCLFVAPCSFHEHPPPPPLSLCMCHCRRLSWLKFQMKVGAISSRSPARSLSATNSSPGLSLESSSQDLDHEFYAEENGRSLREGNGGTGVEDWELHDEDDEESDAGVHAMGFVDGAVCAKGWKDVSRYVLHDCHLSFGHQPQKSRKAAPNPNQD